MIMLQGVSKSYRDCVAVDHLDLDVREGEILGIIGHNGAGKTTILKMITGLISPTEGSIEIMGMDITREGTRIKSFIGYLPEESPFYENMTVTEYLLFFSELYRIPRSVARDRIHRLLGVLNLAEENKLTGELSKGMKRKAAIARTLLHNPGLLILDEPNSGLDPLTSFFIIDYLRALRDEGKTILLSAHNLFHIEYICDRVAILKNGRLVVVDSMESLRQRLGEREYEITFKTADDLPYEKRGDNYIFKSADVGQIASLLRQVSDKGWALVDLSIRQSALEDIYVKLMNGTELAAPDSV
ncbi:MAG: ABC transporter ATP-binding protein [Dehalococcoidales bacterium]|nr:ABC transporter ATP-binding protein [Dehalococcoidales bacterium]